MLIIEGPDGSGKTTLIAQLEERLGIIREPRAVTSSAEPLKPMGQYALDEIGKGFGRRIYDRFNLISSPFYSMLPNPTFRDELRDQEWLQNAWIRFRQIGPLIIVCLPPLGVVMNNCLSDDTSKVAQNDIEVIYWLYHNFAAQYPWVAAVYDYTKHDLSDLEYIVSMMESRLDREAS